MRYVSKALSVPVLAIVSIVLLSSPVMAASGHNHKTPPPKTPPLVLTGTLVFVSDRTGHYEIYEKNLATSVITALTTGSSNSMNPEVSPDGTELVFYSNRTGDNQIYELNLQNPSVVTQLTNDKGGVNNYDPTFTSDGTGILFKKTDSNGSYGDVWEMNLTGGAPQDLTPQLTVNSVEGWKPTSVSPTQVIFTERGLQNDPYSDNLFSLDPQTGVITQLTDNSLTNWYPDYSAITGKVVFITQKQSGGNDVLDTINPDGTDRTLLISMAGDNDDPSWTPNGQQLVFLNDNSGDYYVYAANSNGTNATLLDKGPRGSDDLSPMLLP